MTNKSLATVLLASVLSWSLPPVTVAALSVRPIDARPVPTAPEHSCCPKIHTQVRPSVFAVIPPVTMPCDSRHPCCLRQGQEHAPALPSLKTDSRPDLQPLHIEGSHGTTAVLRPLTAAPDEVNPSESCLLRSTVLRI